MKKNNPHIPIMLREAAGTQPRVYARYGGSILPFQLLVKFRTSRGFMEFRMLILSRVWEGEERVISRYVLNYWNCRIAQG
jgi:hypothetical protein